MNTDEIKIKKLKAIRIALENMKSIIDKAERQLAEATTVLDKLVKDL